MASRPQYTELESLYGCYKDRGFEILDFPCNQFGNQAPGTDEEIRSFCNLKYGVSFPQFAKVDVVGENAEPLFRYLEEHTSFRGFGLSPMGMILSGVVKKMDPDYKQNGRIKWNFTKFLIDRKGNIIERFEPTDMKNLKERSEACL